MAVDVRGHEATVAVPNRITEPLSEEAPLILAHSSPTCHLYRIEEVRKSECSLVLFARNILTSERLVMKVLREYRDTRYSLETIEKRQQCQLEALQRNRIFTPRAYLGLARIDTLELHQKYICINEIVANPTKEVLDSYAEYALIMKELPKEERLDCILSKSGTDTLKVYTHLLSEYVVYIHNCLAGPVVVSDGELAWGSHEQLQRKLEDNFALLDLIPTTWKNNRESAYCRLENRLAWLKDTFRQISTSDNYKLHFERRIAEHRIRHCHGDLKAPHIWITSQVKSCDQRPWSNVLLIDAADFNPSFTSIDVLSDLAFLAVEIQARTRSQVLADLLIKSYLEQTKQQDDASKAVLNYYLVEKAIVGAAISLIFDNEPDLGWVFLEVAEMRLNRLLEEQATPAELTKDVLAYIEV